MSAPRIQASNVVKRIGQRCILDDISLCIHAGEVVGFIGPNGAGKTTLLRILAGMAQATSGTVVVNERTLGHDGTVPPSIGLVPEVPGFVEHLSGVENLRLLASIRNTITLDEVRSAIAACGLDPADTRPVRKYSLGMRQRLNVAQAIMEHPRVLLLDEPTNGLDVVGIAELRTIIRHQAHTGVAVLLASHLLNEVERACDRVLIVTAGRMRKALTPADLQQAASGVRVGVSTERDWHTLSAVFPSTRLEATHHIAGIVYTDIPTPELNRRLVALGVNVEELGAYSISLEQAFMEQIEVGHP
jgi:ABC-2 type transport system ATP-binding protein